MRWGLRGTTRQQPRDAAQHPRRDQQQQDSKGKSKVVFSSFSPLAWLSKLAARSTGAVAAKAEQETPKKAARGIGVVAAKAEQDTPATGKGTTAQAAIHNRASTIAASVSQGSPAGSSLSAATDVTVAADIAPRRRSVGDDGTKSDAAVARNLHRRRHYSIGGDRDLPLGHLISLSRSASAKPPPTPSPVRTLTPTLPPLLSDTEEDGKRPRNPRRQRPRRAGGRRSFSYSYGKAPRARVAANVRVRSPRPGAAVSELERFAVVRRTRDPQREFRASMVEMIASKRMVGQPEELETLLACYLSLNADEHHDCIVKVFCQVWFELNNSTRAAAAPSSRS